MAPTDPAQVAGASPASSAPSAPATTTAQATLTALRLLPALLVAVGVFASFALGANDVSNATGVFILTHLFSRTLAGLIGGVAMAVGALTWGRRMLHTVAFDVVKMDLTMASAAQGVQALVVIVAVSFGFFTSMNQALIGAMAGTGLARGRETVQRKHVFGILRGWAIGPLSGLALAFALEWVTRLIIRYWSADHRLSETSAPTLALSTRLLLVRRSWSARRAPLLQAGLCPLAPLRPQAARSVSPGSRRRHRRRRHVPRVRLPMLRAPPELTK